MSHRLSDNDEYRDSRESGNPCPPQRDWHLARQRSRAKYVGGGMTMVGILAVAILAVVPANTVHAQSESNDGSWVIWPGGALAFPTGRFGEKDEDASAPKDGNKAGFGGGLDAGYFISDFACVGVSYSMNRFDLDVAETPGFDHTGHTSASLAELWYRIFFTNQNARWRPYYLIGLGIGRPKARIEFDPPAYFAVPVSDSVLSLESTVDWASSHSAAVGVMVDATDWLAISVESRHSVVNSSGTARTDLFTEVDGQQFEVKVDSEGNSLRARSNTNWWEVRIGFAVLIR